MAGDLSEALRQRILREGPLPFSEWMRACLYDPGAGYYTRPGGSRITGTGPDADFATPPTLHPFFATAVAHELRAEHQRAGSPEIFNVVEYGGGEGDLARGVLASLDREDPAAGRAFRWHHVEVSPRHRALQAAGGDGRIAWGRPERADAVVLVEVVDAVPFDVGVFENGAWRKLVVDLGRKESAGAAFVHRTGPAFEEGRQPMRYETGMVRRLKGVEGRALAQEERFAFVQEACAAARFVLVVDYGDRGPRLRESDPVRGYRNQQPADVFSGPGEVDITASVDFDMVACAVSDRMRESSFETLESFLVRHGILEALNRTDRTTVEGASSYLRLRQLLLPTGLGQAFKVQVLRER